MSRRLVHIMRQAADAERPLIAIAYLQDNLAMFLGARLNQGVTFNMNFTLGRRPGSTHRQYHIYGVISIVIERKQLHIVPSALRIQITDERLQPPLRDRDFRHTVYSFNHSVIEYGRMNNGAGRMDSF